MYEDINFHDGEKKPRLDSSNYYYSPAPTNHQHQSSYASTTYDGEGHYQQHPPPSYVQYQQQQQQYINVHCARNQQPMMPPNNGYDYKYDVDMPNLQTGELDEYFTKIEPMTINQNKIEYLGDIAPSPAFHHHHHSNT